MAREFRFPDIGEGLTEAEVVQWLVAEGDYVEADQPVVEVETDKAVVEIPSPYAGIVVRHGAAEGETIEVGSVLLVIGEESDVVSPAPNEQENAPVRSADSEPTAAVETDVRPPGLSEHDDEQPSVGRLDEELVYGDGPDDVFTASTATAAAPIVGSLDEDAEDLSPNAGRPEHAGAQGVKALPLVRKLARDLGVDLETVEGSGPEGRIEREDVLAAADELSGRAEPAGSPKQPDVDTTTQAASIESATTSRSGDGRRQMSRLRRTIAANMAKSWAEIPHVTTFDEVDASRLLGAREALGARYQIKVPVEALVVKAILPALRHFPEFNASLEGDELVLHSRYDIGIAVDTPDGLLVAVIRDAESKGVLELAEEVGRLGAGAKERSLTPNELTGQTFTVSNIGAVGGGHGTPIVPYGTVAILSVGRARQKPIVEGDDLVIAPMMPLSLSYDHRVIDGGVGRRFIAEVIENLEEPALFLAT